MAETNGRNAAPFDPALYRLVANALFDRERLFRSLTDPRRNIAAECGHPDAPTAETYQALYERDPVAHRVVTLWPRECWQVLPEVWEVEDEEVTTPFELGAYQLSAFLRGESEGSEDRTLSALWEACARADSQSGIVRYGILLLGLDDKLPLDQPAGGASPPGQRGPSPRRLTFLRPYPESLAAISAFDQNPASPRYQMPERYSLAVPSAGGEQSVEVHWSRVIHVAEVTESSEVYAAPRLRAVLNRILDLEKLYGGSAEMYWRGAFPGYSFETTPSAGLAAGATVDRDDEALRDMIERFSNSLQRYVALDQMTVKSLAPQVVDPSPQIEAHLQAIAVQLQVPKRIFLGSERGELASSQDAAAWGDRVRQRREGYLTPRLIRPLINRLIGLGVLPSPAKGFRVTWPDGEVQSEAEKAAVALQKAQAMAAYALNGRPVMGLVDFLTRVLGLPGPEAVQVAEAATAEDRERQENALKRQQTLFQARAAADPNPPPAPGRPQQRGGRDAA